ncbi:MAG: hypothetical protein NTW86_25070 [Candidatus Sumerlaeota bacterium]|nr:hypothetical protein [Candidatus Sumerlaeota bacterium]
MTPSSAGAAVSRRAGVAGGSTVAACAETAKAIHAAASAALRDACFPRFVLEIMRRK